MNKLNFFKTMSFLVLLFLGSFTTSAQGYVLNALTDSVIQNYCDPTILINVAPEANYGAPNSDIDITISGTDYSDALVTFQVSWGDGSTSMHYGQMLGEGNNMVFTPTFQHTYSSIGIYYITIVATNTANNSQATLTTEIEYLCNNSIFSYSTLNCNGVSPSILDNIPFTFEGASDTVEIYLVNSQMTPTNDLTGGPYTIYASPWWLQANGISQLSTILTNQIINVGMAYTMQTMFGCDPNVTQNCIYGQVFCDDNENGIVDNGEDYISGAQVVLTFGGQQITTTTNVDGYYTMVYGSSAGATDAYIELNSSWLSQNGLQTYQYGDTVSNVSCNLNGQMFNFPLNCDSANIIENECVSGWLFCDENNNGILDNNESGFGNAPVTISGLNGSVTVYTDPNGIFYYSGNQLGGTSAIVSVNPNWLAQNGYVLTGTNNYTVVLDCNNPQVIYFSIDCNVNNTPCTDLWTSISPWIGYYQNTQNSVQLQWGNNGPAPAQSYTLTLTYPAGVTPVTSSFNNQTYTISGNSISWTVSSANTSFWMSDVVYFNVPGGLANGTPHIYTLSIVENGNNEDCNTANNSSNLLMLLGNSYDPNDKMVNNPTYIAPSVQDELTYRVRFQNTGTAPAQDIYILDTLSDNLDWSTFELLDATHYIQVIDLGDGVIKFNFPDIWLPDSTTNLEESQGSLTYRIKENVGNDIGVSIENTAHIFFDFNPAIVTNTTFNINAIVSVATLEKKEISVYPNPFGDVLNIRADENVSAIRIYDLTGKLITSKSGSSIQSIVTTDLKTGVYLVEITAGSQTVTKRVIKK